MNTVAQANGTRENRSYQELLDRLAHCQYLKTMQTILPSSMLFITLYLFSLVYS